MNFLEKYYWDVYNRFVELDKTYHEYFQSDLWKLIEERSPINHRMRTCYHGFEFKGMEDVLLINDNDGLRYYHITNGDMYIHNMTDNQLFVRTPMFLLSSTGGYIGDDPINYYQVDDLELKVYIKMLSS